jgi:hypothetical protein
MGVGGHLLVKTIHPIKYTYEVLRNISNTHNSILIVLVYATFKGCSCTSDLKFLHSNFYTHIDTQYPISTTMLLDILVYGILLGGPVVLIVWCWYEMFKD